MSLRGDLRNAAYAKGWPRLRVDGAEVAGSMKWADFARTAPRRVLVEALKRLERLPDFKTPKWRPNFCVIARAIEPGLFAAGVFTHPLTAARRVPASVEQVYVVARVIAHLLRSGVRCPTIEFRAPETPVASRGVAQWDERPGRTYCRILLDSTLAGPELIYVLAHEAAHVRDFRNGLHHSTDQPELERRACEFGWSVADSYSKSYSC